MAEARHCPACNRLLPEDLAAQFCPHCGAALQDTVGRAGAAEMQEEIPWESSTAELTLIQRLTDTWTESMFRPSSFFRKLRRRGSAGKALLYAIVFIIMGQAFAVFWQQWFFAHFSDTLSEMFPFFSEMMLPDFGRQLFLAPIFALLGLLIMTLVYHVCLILVGAGKGGMETTFRVLAYTEGAQLWQVLPGLGQILAAIWGIVLLIIGLREAHATTTARAVLAFLIPFIACCTLVAGALFFIGSVVTQ